MTLSALTARIEQWVFGHRRALLATFALLTLGLAASAAFLRIDAGFNKQLPQRHAYMQTFTHYQDEFGGANRVLLALVARQGDIFTPEFFATLKAVTDDVFFVPGVDRAQVSSLFTPNVRFVEVTEEGFAGGNVVPADFKPTPTGLDQVRRNILKSNQLGRLVASDFSGALVSAQLLEIDPRSGARLDYGEVARRFEDIRQKYQAQNPALDIHVIGFAKLIGDIIDGAGGVAGFFLIAVLVTALLVYLYSHSLKLTLLPLGCSLAAVIWQMGLLPLLGFGIDPMSMLVPFLVFAIGVSHGVQMINSVRSEVFLGSDGLTAARASFRRLLVPGGVALITDTIGFLTILLIDIAIVRETAIAASLGVAAIVLTNLFLLPVLLSHQRFGDDYRRRVHARAGRLAPLWTRLARFAEPRVARHTLLVSGALAVLALIAALNVKIGDLQQGVPELRADARYNRDSAVITEKFAIGVDVLSVIVETVPQGCTDYEVMEKTDRFESTMRSVPGVHSVLGLPTLTKIANAGFNEGSLKWRVLPRNPQMMVQAVSPIETSSGFLSGDCSAMPVMIFTQDHKADTIAGIVDAVKRFDREHASEHLRFRLAGGNLGVMAATNEVVEAAQFPMVVYVYAAIILLCLATFRSWRIAACIVVPLGLVSLLGYALMYLLDIGLKVSTLPVVALGVGIGVDYGIYLFSRLHTELAAGRPLNEAYCRTLAITGNAVLFTGLTLAIGVSTWIFSPLKFQSDMGILLTFLFLVNMLGAIVLLPALARYLLRGKT